MVTHYDLFAGIGGFSLALEEVFSEPIKHVFCEWEQFPTQVLKQHWPDGEYYGDIADLVADTNSIKNPRRRVERQHSDTDQEHSGGNSEERPANQTSRQHSPTRDWTILTGGFPCQPFSAAGRRRGTADDRYKWPEMFEVIRNVKPDWVIAENVRGLVTWNEGMVLEQVCSDLEAEGYEVQPLIIPAVAVNAPHRRDRVWIIAHAERDGYPTPKKQGSTTAPAQQQSSGQNDTKHVKGTDSLRQNNSRAYPNWDRQWQEVAFATCDDSMDDGLPRLVDGVPNSRAKWRQNSLKAYGNGIVPEVAMNIFKAIKEAENE